MPAFRFPGKEALDLHLFQKSSCYATVFIYSLAKFISCFDECLMLLARSVLILFAWGHLMLLHYRTLRNFKAVYSFPPPHKSFAIVWI